jgi:photosystem II stability/assembly factor-like uncharacterized protein
MHASLAQKQAFVAEKEALKTMRWRSIGPWRAGRSLAVAAHPDRPQICFMGATGGGIWRSMNAGVDWMPLADSAFGSSSVGALAVAPSDPNVVYAGMGETEIRGNISFGDGVYRSLDGGNTWTKAGLEKTFAIAHLAVHPTQPETLYAAALGKVFGPNTERGVFKSTDGGRNWRKVLYLNDSTGAVDVRIDPSNPRVLYATMWQCYRNAYTMSSGGKGSGIYKSVDGGETWISLSKNPGLPQGILGKIGIAPASDGKTVYALIESKQTGLYKSTDAGVTWSRINEDKNLTQRPWYYMHIYVDPSDGQTVYVLNVQMWRSKDGGKSFGRIAIGHSDTHDLWINPKNPSHLILASDGGAEVSMDAGAHWTNVDLATAQFYHVALDNQFPYRIYGAQQDNSAVSIASRSTGATINGSHWYAIPSGESGYVAPHPLKPGVVFGGNYMGSITRYDHTLGESKQVMVYPENYIGSGADPMKLRFNWTFPILFSHHEKGCLFATSQFIHRSCDEGMSWETESPDLTTNNKAKQKASGGPLTLDNTGAETHCTIFTFAESPVKPGIWWAGTDDGLVQLTTNGGGTWQQCNLPGLPPEALISMIEASPFDAATAYVAATRYKWDDPKPYLFKTNDFGKTWTPITKGIASNAYTRVLREDPNQKGLLYAGTEMGMYVSWNAGNQWHYLNQTGTDYHDRLPNTPIHDIAMHKEEKSLVVATHGRSFWVLDDLTPLHLVAKLSANRPILFTPKRAYHMDGYRYTAPDMQEGENAPTGVIFRYFLPDSIGKSEFKLAILKPGGDSVVTYSSTKNRKGEPIKVSQDFYEKREVQRPGILPVRQGMNAFEWDMRYPDAVQVDGGSMFWGGSIAGPKVAPGMYVARWMKDSTVLDTTLFEILQDPRSNATVEDYTEQVTFILQCNEKLSETHKAVNTLRSIRKQLNDFTATISDTSFARSMKDMAKPILDSLTNVEEVLIQTKAKAFQDLLNHPVKLNNKFASLASVAAAAHGRPPKQCYRVFDDLTERLDKQLRTLGYVQETLVPAFNQKANEKRPPAVEVK